MIIPAVAGCFLAGYRSPVSSDPFPHLLAPDKNR